MSGARGAALVVAAACCAAGIGGNVAAEHGRRVAPDGVVHRVEVESWSSGEGQTLGSVLVHLRQLPGGEELGGPIPVTDDPIPDVDASLDLDPSTGEPMVVWSRNEGEGFRLFISRLEGETWTTPVPVTSGSGQRGSRVNVTSSWIHLSWFEDSGSGPVFYRATLDPLDMSVAHGPELLPDVDLDGLVPSAGEPQAGMSTEPPDAGLLMAREVLSPLPGGPGMIVVWGVRDEPIPVDYTQGFELPPEVLKPNEISVSRLSGRVTLSFDDGLSFYYTMRKDGVWTDTRRIRLDAEMSPAAALLEIQKMIREETGSR